MEFSLRVINASTGTTFYRSLGKNGVALAMDHVIGAYSDDVLVGVVRLCREHDQHVLRGMEVLPAYQRRRIGTALLGKLLESLGPHECWCLPWAHLTEFYGQRGFRVDMTNAVPPHLAARCAVHRAAGKDILVMRRHTELPH